MAGKKEQKDPPPRLLRLRCKNQHTWTGTGRGLIDRITARKEKCPTCGEPGRYDGMV